MAASEVVEEAARGAVCAAVLVEELDEALLSAAVAVRVVFDRLVLLVFGEEENGGEALDLVFLGYGLVGLCVGINVDNKAL